MQNWFNSLKQINLGDTFRDFWNIDKICLKIAFRKGNKTFFSDLQTIKNKILINLIIINWEVNLYNIVNKTFGICTNFRNTSILISLKICKYNCQKK